MLLAVDVCEGVMLATERAIQQAVQEGLPICLLLTKVGAGVEEVGVWGVVACDGAEGSLAVSRRCRRSCPFVCCEKQEG